MNAERHTTQRLASLPATVLLVLVAVLPSIGSLRTFFVGDDFDFLSRMQRMDSATDALRMSFWGEWEPLWYLGFYRDWKLWGLDPTGYHVANLAWLALGVVLLFRLVRGLWPEATLAPWAAALLFATHPLHDEAVTYLAARGHPMSTALGLATLTCYVRMRGADHRGRRLAWLGGALVLALLAALAKETALLIPIWIVALEGCVLGRMRVGWRAIGRAVGWGAVFLLPVAAYLGARAAVVGMGSSKLRGPDAGVWGVIEACARFLPDYALIGGLPLPFAFAGHDLVRSLRPLGWAFMIAIGLALGVAAVRGWRREGGPSAAVGLATLGLVLVVVSLLPVFWADLEVKRRYFYPASVGAALMAAAWLQTLAARQARAAWALTLLLSLGGALGLVHRNDLYRQSGRITMDLFENARGAPLGEPSPRVRGEARRIVLLTLPRYLGGDNLSGAYLLHGSDVRSAFRLAGVKVAGFSVGQKCYYAEDYRVELDFESDEVAEMRVGFETPRAYAAARARDPREDREGKQVRVLIAVPDEARRMLTYKILLARGLFRDPTSEVYLFSDGRFRRVAPPESAVR